MSKCDFWKGIPLLFVFCAFQTVDARAQTFTTLLSFDEADGLIPHGPLVQATDGNLYGTTEAGGPHGHGTFFKITPQGKPTTLFSFDGTDGDTPNRVMQAANGDFYGTTYGGGAYGQGTVFEITPGGALTTLYSFCSQTLCPDGSTPGLNSGLAQAANGSFYGTTRMGGAYGYGTVFEITPGGALTTLYSFSFCAPSGCTDGVEPFAGLVQATNGNFYGTTWLGGAQDSGTVFEITPKGVFTTLYSFCSQTGCTDGEEPFTRLVQAADGNFYGTTFEGGAYGLGTIFKITPKGTLTTLHSFDGSDGASPYAGLIQATDGNLYGTTNSGAAYGYGTVFRITLGGTLTTLHDFDITDGDYAEAELLQATNGNFYGTTDEGGTSGNCSGGCGTLFSLSVGLRPFVEISPTFGKVGTPIIILGNNLTGATSVTFDGTTAAFTVVSSSEIKTAVPAGAATGKVNVKVGEVILISNVSFRVL